MEMERHVDTETEMTKHKAEVAETGAGFLVSQIILRTLVVASTMTAVVVTVTSHQSVSIFGLVLEASYKYSSAMRFQVGANVVVCSFCFFVWVIMVRRLTMRTKQEWKPLSYFMLLVHDLVVMTLCVSGCAASSTVGYLAKYGQKQGGWTPFCNYVNSFCNRQALALGFSYLAFLSLFFLSLMAAYKLSSHTTHKISVHHI